MRADSLPTQILKSQRAPFSSLPNSHRLHWPLAAPGLASEPPTLPADAATLRSLLLPPEHAH